MLAHRGDWLSHRLRFRQNSLEAIEAAINIGADGAEVDVRRTADGKIVLHHDATVDQEDLDAGCALPLGTALSAMARPDIAHLAELADVLEYLRYRAEEPGRPVVLNIELKDLPGEPGWGEEHRLAREVASLLAARGVRPLWQREMLPSASAPGLSVLVSSFEGAALGAFNDEAPMMSTALLVGAGDDQERAARRAARAGNVALHVADTATTPRLLAQAHADGLAVVAWTVDDPARALELAADGVAGIITNRPGAVLGALRGS